MSDANGPHAVRLTFDRALWNTRVLDALLSIVRERGMSLAGGSSPADDKGVSLLAFRPDGTCSQDDADALQRATGALDARLDRMLP